MVRLPLLRSARPIPWQIVLSVGMRIAKEGRERWNRLTPHEQRRVRETVKKSRGRLDRLTESERQELRSIVSKALGRR